MSTGKRFNKKNVLAFADSLYKKTKSGKEYYLPMCDQTLAKANGHITRCILGEMYEEFIGKPIARKLTKKEINIIGEFENEEHPRAYSGHKVLILEDEEYVTEKIIDKAVIKNEDNGFLSDYYDDFVDELNLLPSVNDSAVGNSKRAQIARAKRV